MTPAEVYAEYGSWRCWVSWEDPAAPLVELVWQISGMVPRVLVQAGRAIDCEGRRRGVSNEPSDQIDGPSGHTYLAGLSTGLLEVAETVLEAAAESEGSEIRLLSAGSDIDTSEVILRRALDVIQHVVFIDAEELDSEQLRSLLEDRSAVWASW